MPRRGKRKEQSLIASAAGANKRRKSGCSSHTSSPMMTTGCTSSDTLQTSLPPLYSTVSSPQTTTCTVSSHHTPILSSAIQSTCTNTSTGTATLITSTVSSPVISASSVPVATLQQQDSDSETNPDTETNADSLHQQDSDSVTDPDSETEADSREDQDDIRTRSEILDDFCSDWVVELGRDDHRSLAVFLCCIFDKHFNMKATAAAILVGQILGRSDKSVRKWRTLVVKNKGVLPNTEQGRYKRRGVLGDNEELTKMAKQYVQNNSSVKGKPNMTTHDFCVWVNKTLLPNVTLEPGFPRKVSVSTCRRWLLHMGFQVITPRKGIFIDGHERPDVVDARLAFLRRMVKLGFVNLTNAPTPESCRAIPTDIEPPTADKREKTVFIFHDETTFHANDDQNLKWGVKGEKIMKKKGKGAGRMVSDFITEQDGFLALNDTEYQRAKDTNPDIKPYAREYLEYGENREGYWTMAKFLKQIHRAVEIAEIKYPKSEGWRLCWIFDNSSCHNAMAANALNVNKMNVNPGGSQLILRDTQYNGKTQKMYYIDKGQKIAKGLKRVLEERGVCTLNKNKEWMQSTLSQHADFRFEKSEIEKFLIAKGHIPTFLPKFHPELNPIERVWAQAKRYTRGHCNYSIHSLRVNIPAAFDSISLESIRNHYRKVRHFMFGYLEGMVPGKDLDNKLKKYKIAVKSHRRIGEKE